MMGGTGTVEDGATATPRAEAPAVRGAASAAAPDGRPAYDRAGGTEWLDDERRAIDAAFPAGRRRAGLALSGGGIRSATVCCGVLQALDAQELPRRFGWLSTVSGGGYTGIGWLARCAASGQPNFPYRRPENAPEGAPETPMFRLRNHAAYLLAPGLWPMLCAVALLLRKLAANLLTMVPPLLVLAAVFVVVRPLGVALGGGGVGLIAMLVAAELTLLAVLALWYEARCPGHAPASRARIELCGGVALAAVLGLAVILVAATLPDWPAVAWLDPLRALLLPEQLPAMIGVVAALLGGGTLASRMKGRAAAWALLAIATAMAALLVVIAMRIGTDAVRASANVLGAGPSAGKVVATAALPLVAIAAAVAFALSSLLDANALSLHGFYRDRLADAFLGSTMPSPRLSELLPAKTGGPLPIVNATANGAARGDLKRRGRPAAPYTLTPLSAGNGTLGYVATARLEALDPDLDAAAALALSGAAISPHAGRVTGGAAALFLKSMLNARTGRWLPIPRDSREPPGKPFRAGLLDIWRELLPPLSTSRTTRMVMVSDGGHWENLGILSLLHRQCPVIVAIDAEADPSMSFNGLGVATMLARIDADTELSIDTTLLHRGPGGYSARHWVAGTLRYNDSVIGRLLYIKATLTGDEPADVLHYASAHPAFPHETTADQFFSEAQFEAYRALGEHIGTQVAPVIACWLQGGDAK